MFSIMVISISVPINRELMFPFFSISSSLPKFIISCVFDDSHSDRCEVIVHCDFNLYFPDD